MGLLDIIGQDRLNDLLQTKVKNKMLEAKLEENKLKTLQSLSEAVAQYQQQQGWAEKGAMELSPGSEDPNVMNPEIQPVVPDQGKLMNALLPLIGQSNPAVAGQIIQKQTDDKVQAQSFAEMSKLIFGPGGDGGTGQNIPTGWAPNINYFLTGGKKGDPLIQQKDFEVRTYTDPKSGEEMQVLFNKGTGKDHGDPWLRRLSDIATIKEVKQDGTEVTHFVKKTQGGFVPIIPLESSPVSGRTKLEKVEGVTEGGGKEVSFINPFTGTKQPIKTELAPGEKPQTSTEAGRSTLISTAAQNLEEARKLILDKNGNVNKGLVLQMSAPMGGIGEGRKVKAMMIQAIDAPIRLNTGAALNAQEIENYSNMFLPQAMDLTSTGLVKNKLDRLDTYLNGAWSEMYPGRTLKSGEIPINVKGKNYVITPKKAKKDLSTLSNEELLKELEK